MTTDSARITALYAALCALLIVVLAVRVILLRWSTRAGIGDGGDRRLARAIRIHGNAIEYVPIALVLMLVAELNHAGVALLHGCGVMLIAARIAHAAGLGRHTGATPERMLGTIGTIGVIVTLAVVDVAPLLR